MSKEDSLAKELEILKQALRCAQADDRDGVIEKFVELCVHQQEVMEQEAYDATTEVIQNAQRYARCKVQFGYDASNQGFPNQKDNQGKED
jgi:hypothetical protein